MPSGYDAAVHVPQAAALARAGLTVREAARAMGVSKATLMRWQRDHGELKAALAEGRALADAVVEDSLYRRARGLTVTETREYRDRSGGLTQTVTIERELPPDVAACIFWLKNRRPERWRDKREADVSAGPSDLLRETLAKMGLRDRETP